jgi:peptidyl-prolyl cis-trans isomerase B (cyclophilin B)
VRVPSSKTRQRKLARAKYDRQMARKAASARRKRRLQAGIGSALALLLIVFGTVWLLGGFDSDPKTPEAADLCSWTPQDGSANTNLKDVGTPPTKDLPNTGTRPMTITTNQGAPITVTLDVASAACSSASFAYLAGKGFFDNTKCHELTAEGALRCGDPSGTGQGGPTYTFFNENVPAAPDPSPSASPAPAQAPLYPKGTVALIGNAGAAGSNGSQFLIFFKDYTTSSPAYPIIGTVTAGLDVVEKIGALSTVDNGAGEKIKPAQDVIIQSLTVGEAATPAPSESAPTATTTTAPAASPTPTTGQS